MLEYISTITKSVSIIIMITPCVLFAAETKSFNRDILNHKYPGCPDNSICSTNLGIKYQKWQSAINSDDSNENKWIKLLNKSIQSNGFPISVWSFPPAKENKLITLWDSHCKQHRNPTRSVYQGEIFLKDLSKKTLKKAKEETSKKIFIEKAVQVTKDDHIIYPILKNEAPILFFKNGLIFSLENEGKYFHLLISNKGKLKVIPSKKIIKFPEDITCSPELLSKVTKELVNPIIHIKPKCKRLWNPTAKQSIEILLPLSCY